ncbi:hypothetical protein ACKKBG_A33865 [Auxenochlorella protothecoides x Auxenochlorella symbiontica]
MSSGTAHAHGEHTQTSVRHTPGGVSVSASAHSSGNGPMRHETTTSSSPPDFHGMSLHDLCAWLRERNIDYHTAIERGDLEELARNASSG